jgi:V-type H+-transporting ATPase subunit a
MYDLFIVECFCLSAEALTPGCAPSILITFIGMVLFKYDTVALDGCENYMYPGQV